MTDKERVTRLKDTKNVDAWVTQFTIELEEKRPELAEMLTEVGWQKLPKPDKAEADYTNEEKEAVINNRDAHKKIVKAMGLNQKLINFVKTQKSDRAEDGCAYTAINYLTNELGEAANNDLEDLEDLFDDVSLDDSIDNPLEMIKS